MENQKPIFRLSVDDVENLQSIGEQLHWLLDIHKVWPMNDEQTKALFTLLDLLKGNLRNTVYLATLEWVKAENEGENLKPGELPF